MKLVIFTLVEHSFKAGRYYGYGPYVNEINIWGKFADEVSVVGIRKPNNVINDIDTAYDHDNLKFVAIPAFNFLTVTSIIKALLITPYIFFKCVQMMFQADHIHLRCPANVSLIALVSQIFFPHKKKTAKYAGNWDPKAKQPWSYRLQKWILSNTFLTRNMTVLIYGVWLGQSKNIKPFFTASYSQEKIRAIPLKIYKGTLRFIFVGTLSKGKQPFYALQFVVGLINKGMDCKLDFYGEGEQREILEEFILKENLGLFVRLHGNQASETVEKAYIESHFVILPSHSEGWPKVVAEAMFWGVVPLVTPISCVPWMLDYGNRGVLLTLNIENDVQQLLNLLDNYETVTQMAFNGAKWSQQYTLELFESEIKELI